MDLKTTLKSVKLHESTISMLLGALVIIVAGVLLINYFSGRQGVIVPPLEIEETAKSATHKVEAGEDLWKISEKYYGSGDNWQKIAEANNITDPDQIVVGQTLTIPDLEEAIAQISPTITTTLSPVPTSLITPSLTPTPQPALAQTTHTVQKGESLWAIAEKYYKSGYNWVDIAKENKLENPGFITDGQQITIPSVEPKLSTLSESQTSEPISSSIYSVEKGDTLWSIAVRSYGDGYRWIDIAKENNLIHPNLIHHGNVLTLPR